MKEIQDHFELVDPDPNFKFELVDAVGAPLTSKYKCRHCGHETRIPGRIHSFEIPMMAHLMVCREFWGWVRYGDQPNISINAEGIEPELEKMIFEVLRKIQVAPEDPVSPCHLGHDFVDGECQICGAPEFPEGGYE